MTCEQWTMWGLANWFLTVAFFARAMRLEGRLAGRRALPSGYLVEVMGHLFAWIMILAIFF